MQNNILLILPNKKEQAVLLNKLQPAYKIYVADSINDIARTIEEMNIQVVICAADLITNNIKITAQAAPVKIIPESEDDFIKRLYNCIAANIQNKVLSVDLLASAMNMSRPTLYRKIKSITNQTPNELIALARLKQAAILLASANYKVFEVAEMVGFNSPSSFGKAFLKQFKVTPVAYQRINRNVGVQLNGLLSI